MIAICEKKVTEIEVLAFFAELMTEVAKSDSTGLNWSEWFFHEIKGIVHPKNEKFYH